MSAESLVIPKNRRRIRSSDLSTGDCKPAAKSSSQKNKRRPLLVDLTSDSTEPPHFSNAAAASGGYKDDSDTPNASRKMNTDVESDYALALQLQRGLENDVVNEVAAARKNDDEDLDRALAVKLQQEFEKEASLDQAAPKEKIQNDDDAKLALQLQAQLHQQEKEMEEQEMVKTLSGKAWKFVEKVLELHKRLQSSTTESSHFDAVAVDDMVFLAEALFKTQQEFSQAGKPVHVDIGYHYTRKENMTRIKTDGLLTKSERDAHGIASKYNGSSFGDGVYTGNDPFSFLPYGDMGLIVARLKGVVTANRRGGDGNHDTVSGYENRMFVLRKSSQCLALIEYSSSMLDRSRPNVGSEALHTYHRELQKIVDEFMNGGKKTSVPKFVPRSAPDLSAVPLLPLPAAGTTVFSAAPLPAVPGVAPAIQTTNAIRLAHARAIAAQAQSPRKKRRTVPLLPLPAAGTTVFPAAPLPAVPGAAPTIQTTSAIRLAHARAIAAQAQSPPKKRRTVPLLPLPAAGTTVFPAAPLPAVPGAAPAIQTTSAIRLAHASAIAAQAQSPRKKRRTVRLGIPAQISIPGSPVAETLRYEAPATLNQQADLTNVFQDVSFSSSSEDCVICLSALRGQQKVVSLRTCGHEFHFSCVKNAIEHSKSCPVCRKGVGKPQGKMPSGTMTITQNPSTTCAGFAPGCITIQYSIKADLQKPYHGNPGTMHGSAYRTTYLPGNEEGRKLLKRLKFAFLNGLTFSVGTSLTTGQPNQVTWSSIHHKTSLSGGVHGFPDPNFFSNCNQELDALNVPSADDL